MVRILLMLFFIFVAMNTFSQASSLKGRIVADSLSGFAINIVNYTKKIGATNDASGFFEIPAAVNDSIIFSSVQYEVVSLVVSESDLVHENFQIKLNLIVRKLERVHISDVNLSGDISKDTRGIPINPFLNNKSLGLPFRDVKQPTQVERRIYTARSGILDLPINYLNGTLKKLKRLKSLEDLDVLIQKGEQAFHTRFFVEDLGVPENLISDFMYYCAEDDYFKNLLENSKKLSLLEFFKKKSKAYKKHKEIDD